MGCLLLIVLGIAAVVFGVWVPTWAWIVVGVMALLNVLIVLGGDL